MPWLAAGGLLGAVVAIGLARRTGGTGVDEAVLRGLAPLQAAAAGAVTPVMLAATWAGNWGPRLAVSLGTAGCLVHRGQRRRAVWLAALIGGAAGLNTTLKHGFALARPTLRPHLDAVTTYAFPSGHAANTAVLVGALAVLAGGGRAWTAAAGAAGLIGISRAWLNVHWPTDVLAGWMVGGAAVLIAWPWLPERGGGSAV